MSLKHECERGPFNGGECGEICMIDDVYPESDYYDDTEEIEYHEAI